MTTTLNGNTLSIDPSEWPMKPESVGNAVELASGNVEFRPLTATGYRRVWMPAFLNVDPTDASTILTGYYAGLTSSITWKAPDMASSVYVRSVPDSLRCDTRIRANGTYLYTITFSLREVV